MILLILWMCFIFAMSSRPADLSTQDSNFVGTLVGRLVIPDFEELSPDAREEFVMGIDHTVRKLAHACEYALMGILSLAAFFPGFMPSSKAKRAALFSWLICLIYAATDELHQLFVSGRSGQFSDVILDGAGAAVGVLICLGIMALSERLAARTPVINE